MIVELKWHVPALRAIISIEVAAQDYADAGQKAAVVIRQLAHPSERTCQFYPATPVAKPLLP